jgi:hypothetical protein
MIGLEGTSYDAIDQDGKKRADNLKILFDMMVPSANSSRGGQARAAQPMNVNELLKDDKSM